MNAQLDAILRDLESATRRLHALVDTLSDERFGNRSDPAAWAVSECVAHLNLTSEAYLPLVRSGLAEARQLPTARGRRLRRDVPGFLLSSMIGPLPEVGGRRLFKVSTPAAFVPSGNQGRARVMGAFDRLQGELASLLREAEGLPVDRVKVQSPFGNLRYSLYSALVILPRHEHRHIQQAEHVWRA